MQKKIWLDSYPKEVPATINVNEYASLRDVIETAFQKYTDKDAFLNMGVAMSFSELDRMSLHFAGFFQKVWKLKKGDRIAIQMPNLLQYPVVLFGALRAGLVVVNTNPLYTPREMTHQFKDSGAVAIIILAQFASKLDGILKNTDIQHVMITEVGDCFPAVKRLIVNLFLRHIEKAIPTYQLEHTTFRDAMKGTYEFTREALGHDDLAFLQYTGGTTGLSKGAMLTHKNVVANLLQISEWMKPVLLEAQEIIITALPLYHIFSLTVNCLGLFKNGNTNVLITNPRDLKSLIKDIKRTRPTVMTVVSTLLGGLLDHPEFQDVKLDRLKVSVAGGMALNTSVAKRWVERTKTPVIEGYGLTEASPVLTCNPLGGSDQLGTVGLPLPSTEVCVFDESGKEVKFGDEGELCGRGPQVMKGYWNHQEETDNVLNKEGWLRTGDIAREEKGGFFRIVDRKKDMILVSGFNVYPNEVEEVMMKHPKIKEVAAIGVEDKHSGEVVKVFVVSRSKDLTEAEVIAFAKKELTGYKIPKYVEFRDELPKTNVGKILRRMLRDERKAS